MTYDLAWLNNTTALRCLLVEAVANVSGVETTFYLSTKGYVTRAADTPANTVYLPGIAGGVNVSEEINLDGAASLTYGDIELYNVAGERDAWLDYVWTNRSIKVYLGDLGWVRAAFQLIFDGVVADIDSKDRTRLNLKIRDKLERLNSPISEAKVGGTAANADDLIPLTFGEAFNITPLLTNPATLEYQMHPGPIEGAIEIRDNGVNINSYTANNALGKINLTASPAGTITASVQGHKNVTYKNTVASLIQEIVQNYGKAATRFISSDLDTASLDAFEAAHMQPVGLYVPARENVITIIQRLASSIGAVAVMSRAGKLQLLQITIPPTGTPTEISAADITEGSLRIVTRMEVIASVKIGYCRNWTLQDNLQTGIPDAHKEFMKAEWLTVTKTNATAASLYRLDAEPVQRDTLLLSMNDANAEASRHLAIYSTPRTIFGFEGFSQLLFLNLGDTINLTHPRFGLSVGKVGIVVKLQPDWMTSRVYCEVMVETIPAAIDTTLPSAPGTLTATAVSPTEVDLSWVAATDNVGVVNYNVYVGGVLTAAAGDVLSYRVIDLTAATAYSFYIRGVDEAENIGPVGNTANATTFAAVDTTNPTAPTLTATAASSSAINLTWTPGTDNVGVTAYQIFKAGIFLDTVLGNVFAYQSTGLTLSTAYAHTVKSVDAAGNLSPASNSASATTLAASNTQIFANTAAITIGPDVGQSTPYPSSIVVSGMADTISKVVVKLYGLSHAFTADVEVVLQSPDASKYVMLMSDCGGNTVTSNITLTFDMAAGGSLPATAISTGTYLPTNITAGAVDTNLPSPAPIMPYSIDLAVFNGMSPNGTWKLFVNDEVASDAGSISGGWDIAITTAIPAAATQTFTNATAITLPATQAAGSPYPSTITVSGMGNTVTKAVVKLYNISHTFPSDIEVVLQSPDTSKFIMLMGDAGSGTPVTGVNLTFDASAGSSLTTGTLTSGTYLPTNVAYGSADTDLPSTAPAGTPAGVYSVDLGLFNGISPNGTWKLFVYDDGASDSGSIGGGWDITLTTDAVVVPPPSGGAGISSLTKTVATASNLNLSTKGTVDWWKYGLAAAAYDTAAKSINGRQIHGAFTLVAGYDSEGVSAHTFQWTDGKPVISGSANARGLKCQATVGSGWEITVSASATPRIFTLYATTFSCTSKLTVSISDNSSPAKTDTIVTADNVASSVNYAIAFSSPGATLTIRYEILSVPGATAPYLQIAASTLE